MLLCSLVVQQLILLSCSRLNNLWLGWVLNLSLFWALFWHLSSQISLMINMGTNEVLGDCNHPLQSIPVSARARPKPISDVSSQNAFYCSFVEVKNRNFV